MFKPSGLLKVISILIMIGAVLGLIGTVILIFFSGTTNEVLAAAGVPALSTFDYVVSLVSVVCSLAAGIAGVSGKNKKVAMLLGIVILAIAVVDMITTTMTYGFLATSILGLIFPLLYIWGVYQSY
ncbi:MAG: hypothetical protein HFH53_00190 [Hespellia sp.]|jgi:hypothetical protein|nr:hypothetical protein [Hespellia sp.]